MAIGNRGGIGRAIASDLARLDRRSGRGNLPAQDREAGPVVIRHLAADGGVHEGRRRDCDRCRWYVMSLEGRKRR